MSGIVLDALEKFEAEDMRRMVVNIDFAFDCPRFIGAAAFFNQVS